MRVIALFSAIALLALSGCAEGEEMPVSRDATPAGVTATAAPSASATPVSQECAPPASLFVPAEVAVVFCVEPSMLFAAEVVRVIDGDTFEAEIDGREETVRVFGVDTPERGDRCADEATERFEELAHGGVRLRADVRNRDSYGRLLRYVYTDAGLSIDASLLAEGLAEAWRRDGALRDPLIAIEEAARARSVGCLWR